MKRGWLSKTGTDLDFTSSARVTRQLRPFGLLSRPNGLLLNRHLVHVVGGVVSWEGDIGSFHYLRGGEEGIRIGD